jgi:hypothetical protein
VLNTFLSRKNVANVTKTPVRQQAWIDKRNSPRQASRLNAVVLLDNGLRIRCIVKDFSKTGALLIVPTILGIPDQFSLQFTRACCGAFACAGGDHRDLEFSLIEAAPYVLGRLRDQLHLATAPTLSA